MSNEFLEQIRKAKGNPDYAKPEPLTFKDIKNFVSRMFLSAKYSFVDFFIMVWILSIISFESYDTLIKFGLIILYSLVSLGIKVFVAKKLIDKVSKHDT